jgi:hypothetical protein
MSVPPLPLATWSACLRSSVDAIAQGFGGVAAGAEATPRVLPWGGYISLLGESDSIRLGVSASAEGCAALARGLLELDDGVEVPNKEVADALCEMVNIIAGHLKAKVQAQTGRLNIGLPMFLTEPPRTNGNLEVAVQSADIGGTPVALVIMRSPRPHASAT